MAAMSPPAAATHHHPPNRLNRPATAFAAFPLSYTRHLSVTIVMRFDSTVMQLVQPQRMPVRYAKSLWQPSSIARWRSLLPLLPMRALSLT